MPAQIETLFNELVSYIDEVKTVFIRPFLPPDPTTRPEAYKFQVTAFCVLSHAALEEYVEKIALRVTSESIDKYINSRGSHINKSLAALSLFFGPQIAIDEDESSAEIRFFDRYRSALAEIKDTYSKVIHKNHGVSIKYLRSMLEPIAIDIKDDPTLKNSLSQLANARGTYAHKKVPSKFISPEDAEKYVNDCLNLALDIKDKAKIAL